MHLPLGCSPQERGCWQDWGVGNERTGRRDQRTDFLQICLQFLTQRLLKPGNGTMLMKTHNPQQLTCLASLCHLWLESNSLI